MEPIWIIVILLVTLFGLLGSGVWVAFSLLGVAYLGLELFGSSPTGFVMATSVWSATSSWILTSLPLFIWMGEILFRSGLSESMFSGLRPWVSRIPGGLLHVNILGCAMFAAVSGSSAVTAATIGKITLPELRALGYPENKSIATLAGSGTLGFLIPPSILLIVYGAMAEVSIARLFIAGIIPGLMLVALFMGYVILWAIVNPGQSPTLPRYRFRERVRESRRLIPILLLIVGVLGSIYAGFATPTEAAAVGVIGGLILSYVNGVLTRENFAQGLLGATRTSCMIGFIIGGAAFLTTTMGFTKLPLHLAQNIIALDLSPLMLVVVLTIFYILIGCFLEGISIIVLSAAVILPMIEQAGFDLVWFGIYLVIVVELALITPPIGFNLFIIQGLTGRSIFYVARVTVPFFFLLLIGLTLIVIFPGIATYLPTLMGN